MAGSSSDVTALDKSATHNLAAVELGARAIACNDAHFGVVENLLNPGQGINMGDGWETRRRREPGNDWCIIELGQPGSVEQVINRYRVFSRAIIPIAARFRPP